MRNIQGPGSLTLHNWPPKKPIIPKEELDRKTKHARTAISIAYGRCEIHQHRIDLLLDIAEKRIPVTSIRMADAAQTYKDLEAFGTLRFEGCGMEDVA